MKEDELFPSDVRVLVKVLGCTLDEEALKPKFKMLMDIELPTFIDMREKGTIGDNALDIVNQILTVVRDSSIPSNEVLSSGVI